MGVTLTFAAALWGFAEATLFFIVPDVLLTVVALENRRRAMRACGAAVAGALAGGLLMYLWGSLDEAGARTVLDAVPAIGPGMTEAVRSSLAHRGVLAVFLGPLTGTPYKIYAVLSGGMGIGLPVFLLVSVPARGVRFFTLTLLASWASRGPLGKCSVAQKRMLLLGFWLAFYIGYFATHWA